MMTLAADPVLLAVSPDGVAEVLINRAERGNALDELAVQGLADAFETLKGADHVRIVFVRGAGARFCAGYDRDLLERRARHPREDNEADARAFARMYKALHDLPQLTVALAQGEVRDAGVGLIAACDVTVMVKTTGVSLGEVRLGLIAGAVGPFLVEAVGPRWARALMVSGESFDGAYAEKIGLAQYLVDDEAGLDVMAEHLASLAFAASPGATDATKALLRHVSGQGLSEQALHEASRREAGQCASAAGREGLGAHLEGRKPSWIK